MSASAEYHGADLAAAYERARAIHGAVIVSKPPESGTQMPALPDGNGYWSDDCGLVRAWELEVWSTTSNRSLALVQKREAARLAGMRGGAA